MTERRRAPLSYAEAESDGDESERIAGMAGSKAKRKKRGVDDDDDDDEEPFEWLDDDADDDDHVNVKPSAVQRRPGTVAAIVDKETTAKRDAFLWEHRALFLPLLPPHAVSHFTHLQQNGYERMQTKIVPKTPVLAPKMITATLKDYQLKGLEFFVWLVENGMNGILGDEMGLGKTLQTLSLLSWMKESGGKPGPYLVVCPLSVLSSWENEIKRWTPTMTYIRFHGPINERNNIKRRCLKEKFDIYVTTFEQLVAEASWFNKGRGWRCVVLDEGHKIKNDKANMSAVVYSIASQYRFILTGTPLQNNLQELWALLHYLYPFIFTPPTAKFFLDSFNLQRGSYNHGCIDSARKLLDLIMLRRLKSTVDLSIPAKEEHIIYLPLTPMQRFWYKRMLTRIDNTMIGEIFTAPIHTVSSDTSSTVDTPQDLPADGEPLLDDINGGAKSILPNRAGSSFDETKEIMKYAISSGKGDWAKLMNLLLQLRKVCNHPYILPNSEPEPYENGEHLVLASSKLIFLDKFLPKLFADGHRVLIFSQFTKMLDIMEDFMRFRGIAYARLDGRTSRARRNLDIRLFQRKDSPYNVFLISTKAGGLGINLTTADTIIMMDSDWNPQNDLQAMARSHRIGQTKNVKVYRTICQDTVEEQMLTRLQKKLFLSLKVTAGARRQDDGEDSMPTLSKDDLMTIFRYGSRTITSDADDDPEVFLNKSVEDILNASVAHQKSVEALLEGKADAETVKPEFELAGLESVKSRFFEGKNHARKSKTNGDIAKEWMQEEKRTRVQRTVSVGENMVLKELEGCEQWEATPVMTSAQTKHLKPRGKGNEKEEETPKKRTRKKHDHQELCVVCAEPGMIVMCSGCPRVVHPKCVGSSLKEMERTVLFFCPQHNCCICDRKTQDAGGLLFRCGSCANSYCEDCLPIDEEIREIGDALPEFEALGYGAINQAFYIYCPPCLEHHKKVETSLLDVTPMQHEDTIAKGAGDIGSNSVQEARESGIAVALDAKAAVFHENGHWGEPPKHVLEAITLDSEIVESVDRVPSTLDVMDVHLLGRNGTTALDSVEKEFCTS